MYQREEIIEQLGIGSWPEEKQNEAAEVAVLRVGEAVTQGLNEQQLNEYQAIIDDDHNVIDAWLENNAPNYKESPVYKEIEAGYSADPEKNNPAKLFASLAWIRQNVPNAQEAMAQALEAYKQELSL